MHAVSMLVLALLFAGCGSGIIPPAINTLPGRTEAAAAKLAAGMTREQVVQLLGQPQGLLTERNRVECLIYTDRDAMSLNALGRDRLVVLRNGRLIQHQLVNVGATPNVVMQMPGAPTSASVCAQAATATS
jgi:hypothetical protein